MGVPDIRIRACNERPVRPGGDYVLYWMIAARRTCWNFALDHALARAAALDKPLVVLEALRNGYPWASDRLHAFVIQGMRDNAEAMDGSGVVYYPYVERAPGEGRGLLEALAERATQIVTDDFPAFFLRRMVAAAAGRIPVRMDAVDSNGLVPLRATPKAYPTAYSFRLFLQRSLSEHLQAFPAASPLPATRVRPATPSVVPATVRARWPRAGGDLLAVTPGALAGLPIDHGVGPVETRGGSRAGAGVLRRFLAERLAGYATDRNQPERDVASGLSPYLHFGHVSPHQVFDALMTREGWTTRSLSPRTTGRREGWWGASVAAESFLDELITWREVGLNACEHRPHDYDQYASLPDWARATLGKHASDPRPHVYSLEAFEAADTHDPLWNAAQTQLVREGRMHNYLRMLWGKKILEWTPSPQDALDVMVELNNKYALDGRDPNSYSGILWVLGRYDRPWAPERPVFGSVRYMSSANTAKKLRVKDYVRTYSPGTPRLI